MKQKGAKSIPLSQAHPWGWRPALLLFVLVFLFYLPAIHGGFVWDDVDHLTENPCIIGPLGLTEIWTSAQASICPLVLTTFWVEYRLWGLDPMPYHVVNVLMHAAAALVLWRVLLRMNIPGAWLGAALWALHPVQVESVAWITEMKNTQSGLFFLLSLLFFCRWKQSQPAEGRGQKKRATVYYALVLICGFFAMASKSSTVVLPVALALCAWWMDGCWRWRRHLPPLIPLLLMSAAAGMVSMWTQRVEGTGLTPELTLSGLQRVAVAGRALWFYLGKLAWPHPLLVIYPRWEIHSAVVANYLPAIAAVIVSAVLWWNRKGPGPWRRGLWLAWAFFVACLLPVLGFVDHSLLRFSFVFDHFQYLASMGPLALAGCGIIAGLQVLSQSFAWIRPACCCLLLLGLGTLTSRQCGIYKDEDTLWTAALAGNSSCSMVHNSLGIIRGEKGQVEDAMIHFQKAVELDPRSAEAHHNLGLVLGRKGRLDEAVEHFQKAVELKPEYAQAHNSLGLALKASGRLDDAKVQFQTAVSIASNFMEARRNLASMQPMKEGATGAAGDSPRDGTAKSSAAEIEFGLGDELYQKGQLDESLQHFQRAVEIDPGYAEAHNYLAIVLSKKGRSEEAMAHFQKAIEIRPTYFEAHHNLGFALQKMGRVQDAVAHYEKAIEINPDYATALRSLAFLLATSNQASLRDGARAVELAQRANKVSGGGNAMVLGTLAAAEAEAGSFPEAMAAAQEAIRQAEAQELTGMAEMLKKHLELYQRGQPLRSGL